MRQFRDGHGSTCPHCPCVRKHILASLRTYSAVNNSLWSSLSCGKGVGGLVRDLLGVLSTVMPILQGQQLKQKGDGLLTDLKKYRWEGAESSLNTEHNTGQPGGEQWSPCERAAQLSQHLSGQDSPLPSSPFSNPSPKSPNCYVGGRQTSSEKLIISKLYAMKSLFLPIPCTRFNDPGLDSVHSWCSWSLESQHWCKARSSARRSSGEWHLVEAHVGQTNDYCSDSVYS